MSTAIAEDLVGASLKALAKGAGEEGVKEICSSLMGSIFGGGDDSSAAADAKILDQLNQIMSSLSQVQDSLQRIEQAVAQVDLDIAAAAIQQQVSTITSTYDTYFDCLNGLATAAKGTDPASLQSFAEYRQRLVDESIKVKNDIPTNLDIIHGFIIDQDFLGKLATASMSPGIDIVDFYSKVKLPLVKIAMVEIKGIHLLRFAGAANQDSRVDFPDASAAIQHAMSNIDLQDQALPTAIGVETYGFVSAILTAYPKPAPACISPLETRGLTFGNQYGDSTWYGSEHAQLWHVEPANDGPVVTDGSKVNAFRLLHVDSKKYLSHQAKHPMIFGLQFYDLTAVDSSTDAAIWNFQLTPEHKFFIQSQAYPDTYLTPVKSEGDDDQNLHYVYITKYLDRAANTQTFVGNAYQGSVGNFWPGNVTEMHDGEYLIPGSYLYDNHQTYSFGFKDNKMGAWDIKSNIWKWDFGIIVGMSHNCYLRFSNSGVLTLYNRSEAVRAWGPPDRGGTNYVLGMSYEGSLLIETGDSMYGNWSSDKPDMVQLPES